MRTEIASSAQLRALYWVVSRHPYNGIPIQPSTWRSLVKFGWIEHKDGLWQLTDAGKAVRSKYCGRCMRPLSVTGRSTDDADLCQPCVDRLDAEASSDDEEALP